MLAFEDTGAYRLLLPAMSEDPAELQRFFAETVEPLVTYDEQYETDLVQTLETFLDADANVAGTASRLFTHRHTIRYRLERVRDLTGLDVSSTDGREKLGLGLKAMRVLGVAAPARSGHRGRRRRVGASGATGRIASPRTSFLLIGRHRTRVGVVDPTRRPHRCAVCLRVGAARRGRGQHRFDA